MTKSKGANESFNSIEKRFSGKGYNEFKKEVAEVVCVLLQDIQQKYNRFNKQELLDKILYQGAKKARVTASKNLNNVLNVLGLK